MTSILYGTCSIHCITTYSQKEAEASPHDTIHRASGFLVLAVNVFPLLPYHHSRIVLLVANTLREDTRVPVATVAHEVWTSPTVFATVPYTIPHIGRT
eukprot:scaffold1924_cov218-Amphora_coffeaeformis.AAC.7